MSQPDIRLWWPLTIQYKRCRNLNCDYFGRSDCPMVTWLDDIFLPDAYPEFPPIGAGQR